MMIVVDSCFMSHLRDSTSWEARALPDSGQGMAVAACVPLPSSPLWCMRTHLRAGHVGVLQVYQSVSGLHHPDTFNCLTSLVALLRGAGKASQALPLAQRCLGVKKKSLGELHPDTAASMQVVADVMLDLGRWGTRSWQHSRDAMRHSTSSCETLHHSSCVALIVSR